MSRVLTVTWLARPGHEERVAEILRMMVEKTRQEPGCIHYDVNRSIDDPCRFLIYEVYRDDAALNDHQESDHFQRHVIGEALPLLQSRERVFYRPLE